MTLAHRLESSDGLNPLTQYLGKKDLKDSELKIHKLLSDAIGSMEKQRFKEALRSIMNISQLGNGLIQHSEPWKYLNAEESIEKSESMATLAFCWQICRGLSITLSPFIPFQSDKLWTMLGESIEIDDILYENSFDFSEKISWNTGKPMPLFTRLDIENILEREKSIAGKGNMPEDKEEKDVRYIEFEDFMKVEMKTGKVIAIDDHPNADKLYVVTIEDGPESTRTVCAGLKGIYEKEQLLGKQVIFVANLKPRKLRGIMSEGMILAADDGDGKVSVLTLDSEMPNGSQVR
jgi:methionyl-tRNA synthetase